MPALKRRPLVGLALGSGSARGWAHIGVLRALTEAGIGPDVVCGASVGALVGAAYATGGLDRFETWVRGMNRRAMLSFMDFQLGSGMLKGERLVKFMRGRFDQWPIEALATPFAAVATALRTGDEVWLRSGSVTDAVRASFAMPGLFTPVWHDGQLLVDGALVNPVPVSLARALGAELVIAVDLNGDPLARYARYGPGEPEALPRSGWKPSLPLGLGVLWPRAADGAETNAAEAPPPLPTLMAVVTDSLQVMQVRITRSRLAGDPPNAIIAPRLAHLGLLDFHRGAEAIEAGHAATRAILPQLRQYGLGDAHLPGTQHTA